MKAAAIIVDDFSSATDCGVQFTNSGLDTVALTNIPAKTHHMSCDVVAIDTDSRCAACSAAYQRVFKAAGYVKDQDYRHIYKSLDSTLRGNLGAEIDAMMDALHFELAIIAPAFPHYGRTTINGCHYLNGVQITESFMAADPTWPARESDISRLLSNQSKRKSGLITLDQLRQGIESVLDLLKLFKADGKQLIIIDAETEEDLKRIATISATFYEKHLIAGSTGLSQYLPAAWDLSGSNRANEYLGGSGKPIILVAGSASPATRRQIEKFVEEPGTHSVEIGVTSILTESWRQGQKYTGEIGQAVEKGQDVAIYLDSLKHGVETTVNYGLSMGLDRTEIASRVATALGVITSRIVASGKIHALILTGGDTAKAACRELQAEGMRLIGEVEPGIPVGRLMGRHEILAVTKAGAFGSEYALDNARKVLRGVIDRATRQ